MDGKKDITIGGGLSGTILTAAIIAVRAFQPCSEPMSEWSVWSWILMTLPITLPPVLGLAFLVVWAIAKPLSEDQRKWR